MPRNKKSKQTKEEESDSAPIRKKIDASKLVQGLITQANDSLMQSLGQGSIYISDPDLIAKNLTLGSLQKIEKQLTAGSLQLSERTVPFDVKKHTLRRMNLDFQREATEKEGIEDFGQMLAKSKISSIHLSLKQLHKNMEVERYNNKSQAESLRKQAKQFVSKIQKDKQEFNEKLKSKKSESRLLLKAYSEDTITQIKGRLNRKKEEKREELQSKIMNIQKRKLQRVEKESTNEINHWEKVKRYESSKSARVLPQISRQKKRHNPERQFQFNVTPIHQKSSMYKKDSINSVRVMSLHDLDKKMIKAKLKLQKFQQKFRNSEISSIARMNKMLSKNQPQEIQEVVNSNSNVNVSDEIIHYSSQKPLKNDPFNLKYSDQRFKILGNHYLRKSLEENSHNKSVQKSKFHPMLGVPEEQGVELAVNISNLHLNQNHHQSVLEQSWRQTLRKLQNRQIDKIKALDLLSSIEKKLDRYDREGMSQRLRKKVEVIDRLQSIRNVLVSEATSERISFSKQLLSVEDCLSKKESELKADSEDHGGLANSENEFINEKNEFLAKAE